MGTEPGTLDESAWADALAVTSVVLPLVVLVVYAATGWRLVQEAPAGFARPLAWVLVRAVAGPLLLLALARLRPIAALAAAGLLIWDVAAAAGSGLQAWLVLGPAVDAAVFAVALEAVALTLGPRRGPRRLTRTQVWCTAAAAAAVGLPGAVIGSSALRQAITLPVIVAAMAGLALVSPLSRRVLLLLAVPVYFFAASNTVPPSSVVQTAGQPHAEWEALLRVTLICLPLAVLGGLALAAAWRAPAAVGPPG